MESLKFFKIILQKLHKATKEGMDGECDRASWKNLDIGYVIKLQISEQVLSAKAFSISEDNIKNH